MLLSGSRDKTLIIWNLTRDETNYGYPKRSLHGHSHIVSDCVGRPGPQDHCPRADLTRLSPLMAPTRFPHPGTRPSGCGSSPPASPPVASSATKTTSSPSPSPPTTAKSSLAPAIGQSSCGILWATASSRSRRRAIRNGSHAFASARTLRTRSSSRQDGTNSSRYATCEPQALAVNMMQDVMNVFATSEPSGHETALTKNDSERDLSRVPRSVLVRSHH